MTIDLHADLAKILDPKRIPRMTAVALEDLSKDDTRLREYVVGAPVRIRVAQQVDFTMDALIRDGELGSLGIVHRVDADTDVRKRIDEAAYLRHLLIEETRSAENVNRPPYAVEVVFAVTGGDVPKLAETLRTILRDGMYLHAIGVNVWRPENGSLTDDAAVRRAFSWLLAETESWFASRPSAAGTGEALRRIALTNLRIAGPRVFELRQDHQLHIVHGHNGSGKSSLSEALELLATGKVARLEGQDHGKCLASREIPDGTATIEVKFSRKKKTWTVETNGITDPLGTMNPNAFRLDQTVADRLTHSTSADRARIFLSAFFEVESKGLLERNKLLADAKTHFANLSPKIAQMIGVTEAGLDDAMARTQLQWLAEPNTTTWEKFLELMPLTKTQVHDLGAMLPREIGERYQQTGPAMTDDLQKAAHALDEALKTLVPELDQRKETLTKAVAVLEHYGTAAIGGDAESGGDLPVLLRRWMRLHARTDLFERQARIAETVNDAIQRGAERGSLGSLLAASAAVPAQDLDASRMQRDEARGRVISFVSEAEAAVLAAAALEPMPAFPPNVDALTAAAALGVFGDELRQARPALGQALRDALAQGRPVDVQAGTQSILTVGTQGWGRELLAKAKAALAALTQLAESRAELPVAPRTLESLLPTLRELHRAATQIGKLDAEDVQRLDTLFAENGELRQALNELTALFTPARWAYRDVIPAADLKSSEQRLDLQAYGISAKFLLNTAELNTLALAIFLLCSRRAENPLRTLVLDDPLQNMDELTVTTIARGLARLLRLWKRHLDKDGSPWRLFLLLHGEDDVERIRGEVPCDVHLLPWLSPSAAAVPAKAEVPVSTSLLKDELQTLRNVILAIAG